MLKHLLGVLFCLGILLAPVTTYAAWQPTLLVGLTTGVADATVQVQQATVIKDVTTGKVLQKAKAGETLAFASKDGQIALNGKKLKAEAKTGVDVVVADERELPQQVSTINGQDYRGGARVLLRNGTLTVINKVPTEEYLYSVMPKEISPSWNSEVLKAQAVATRSFALHNRKRHASAGYDLCTTTHCQVYQGMSTEMPATNAAVDATRGEVLTETSSQMPIDALFHTDSGGMTENSEDVWGTKIPYLRAATEVHEKTQPWERNVTETTLTQKLAKQGHNIGNLKKIKLSPLQIGKASSDRTVSGRVKRVEFEGSKGKATISGNDLRSLLGLPSTMFTMTYRQGVVFITGYGAGHGLGMSQWGAKAFADEQHLSYEEILQHYYAGTKLTQLYKK